MEDVCDLSQTRKTLLAHSSRIAFGRLLEVNISTLGVDFFYILTLPTFTWIPAASGDSTALSCNNCEIIGQRQMLNIERLGP